MLAALARTATRRPLTVISAWLLLIALGFGVGTGVFGRLSDSVAEVSSTESDRAAERLAELDPTGESISAVVEGPVARADVERAVADVRGIPGVAEVPDPYTTPGLAAENGRALLIPVTLDNGLSDDATSDAVNAAADRIRTIDADQVAVSGGPLLGEQMGERAQKDVVQAELISMPVVLLLLLVIFGGLRAAGMPLVIAVTGVGGAFAALFAFSLVTDVSVYAIQITTMLGLGLAVDYALLMVVRFREERASTEDIAEAVHRTVARAGRTVLFSGVTVAVSLAGLLVFPNTFLRSMGLAVAAVVVVDMLAALTLLPALLARFGGKITASRKPREGREQGVESPPAGQVFARIARFSAARPMVVTVAVVAGLAVLALPALGMKVAVGDARSLPSDTQARQLYDAMGEHYPTGTGIDPVNVLIAQDADPALADRFSALPGVAASATRTLPDGTTVLSLTPTGTVDGAAATGIVEKVREIRADEPVEVTGTAARLVDFRTMLADNAPWAAAIVLLGIFALLFAFTGSVLIPLRTILTTLLSLGAALGIVTWVFQDGHLAGWLGAEGLGELSITAPPLIIAIAFGLAMDYELFILARMRESWLDSGDAREAVVVGVQRSGRVVTCAALLLAVVFAAFMTGGFSPILQIGLGLTMAILIDATVVRMFLVPATMTLLGDRAWWAPSPLRRVHARYGLKEDPAELAPAAAATR
ncbi:MMPL family transporter [Streptomyces apocyni]|uniref:MMPL family transporter n=1 Tax=Streptomyces apocyni TaxID=2654677 RepID=UPI0012EA7B33|nr:MMPL family transporter [Streptomyces apocyni]